ncbi:MAG TPA: phosphoethanolamine transferase CptA [Candidatus Desulfobacillus sp.]|nr:phosphoethanolamine transferase CptA [Candidatus Desulfobacillus sp.]
MSDTLQTPAAPALPAPAAAATDWRGLAWAYLFFWYFSGVDHLLLAASGATNLSPLRHGLLGSLLWLLPLLAWPRQAKRLATAIGLLLWVVSLVNLGYFAIYRQEFSESVLFVLLESNPTEASEYFESYFAWWMIPALAVYTAGAWWLWRRLRPLTLSRRTAWLLAFAIVALLVLPGAVRLHMKNKPVDSATLPLALAHDLEPVVPWQFVVGSWKYRQHLQEMQSMLEQNRRLPPLANLVDTHAGQPATLVLVIGESTSRLHMGLYGYPRPTTPRLEAMRPELTVFTRVVAARPYTIEALQQALTFADQEHPDRYLDSPSLMNLMRQAGYKSWWISNQQALSGRNTMLASFAAQTDEQVYLNHGRSQGSYSYDGKVLEPFERILADPAERKFIVVHLLGTHSPYYYRYPSEFARFADRSGLPDWVGDRQLEWINHYDNAVLYNDQVVASLIDRLRQGGGRSLLLYFSDHGEDVYDSPPHDFRGRNEASPTLPIYAIPFILWRSPQWQQAWPRRFDGQTGRPFQAASLIHTWADLAGLSFDGHDPAKSLINPRFRESPLLAGDPGSPKRLIDLRRLQDAWP